MDHEQEHQHVLGEMLSAIVEAFDGTPEALTRLEQRLAREITRKVIEPSLTARDAGTCPPMELPEGVGTWLGQRAPHPMFAQTTMEALTFTAIAAETRARDAENRLVGLEADLIRMEADCVDAQGRASDLGEQVAALEHELARVHRLLADRGH